MLEGNIAPYAVVTNGAETRIFDSFTRERVNEKNIDLVELSQGTTLYLQQNLPEIQATALEALLSSSPINLLHFCQGQVAYRMRLLYSDDLYSGKKFIPDLYVDRSEAQRHLCHLLDIERRRVVAVVGSPQVGKTNFVCHMAREWLSQGRPCLFYPAIGLSESLLQEIAHDFESILSTNTGSVHIFIHKLRNILRQSKQRLVVFIDGWNEANVELARQIDRESARLDCEEIQIVITLTNVAAMRLLTGQGDNLSAIANQLSITSDGVQLLEIASDTDPLPISLSVVRIQRYSDAERNAAYEKYAKAYNVQVPLTHNKVYEPYMLGAAMKLYHDQTLPGFLDEPELLRRIIDGKIRRAVQIDTFEEWTSLRLLAKKMLISGAPITIIDANQIWGRAPIERIPNGFFEAALLALMRNDQSMPSIDFYYGRESDYLISCEVGLWHKKLASSAIELDGEFTQAIQTNAGFEALQWFLRQPRHIEAISASGEIPRYRSPIVRRLLVGALCHLAPRFLDRHPAWLQLALSYIEGDSDNLVRIEAIRLCAIVAENADEITAAMGSTSSLKEFMQTALSVSEEYPLSTDGVGGIILEAFRTFHHESDTSADGTESDITDVLEELLDNESPSIREEAAICLGHISAEKFFKILAQKIKRTGNQWRSFHLGEFLAGIDRATSELEEIYYGSMCPGRLDWILGDDGGAERVAEEYDRLTDIFLPIIYLLPACAAKVALESLLDQLDPEGAPHYQRQRDWRTLPLPF